MSQELRLQEPVSWAAKLKTSKVADSEKDKSPKKSQPNAFLKYSHVGFVMAAAIGIFLYAGMKLDAYLENEKPLWTIIGALVGVLAAMYYVIKDFSKK